MNKITGKVSNIIIAFFIGAIIISFALTGFSGFNNTANSVGNVDGNPITIAEYNNAFNMQLQRYTQIFKKDLTAQQIRQFRVKENALNELINKKVMVNYAQELNLKTANEEIKESIKELPYFKTNDKFDVNKYKSLLTANNLTPCKI
jgi:peptidyl-prolyl cis-trans isomerase D